MVWIERIFCGKEHMKQKTSSDEKPIIIFFTLHLICHNLSV